MELAPLIAEYGERMTQTQAKHVLPGHRRALTAMGCCRSAAATQMLVQCSGCQQQLWRAQSCGHRSCPTCQNHAASQWLDRQREKLLPVEYFLVTFTLPAELRPVAFSHQRVVYDALLSAAADTLKVFGLNPKHLGATLGMSAVLHTHTRRLDYHPHVHVVIPGGGIDAVKRLWKRTRYQYLFNAFALATVYRAKFLEAINQAGLTLPGDVPAKWVVDCTRAGTGEPALEYLSRYLYRGVIAERNIIANDNGEVTFRYTESKTGLIKTRTLPGEEFLWLLMQHVLPRGFRRVRDYGFLHHNAKAQLQLVQLVLQVKVAPRPAAPRPCFLCCRCGEPMRVVGVLTAMRASLYRNRGPPKVCA